MGSSSRPASSVQTQVRQEYPAFFQPHLEDVLAEAQSQFGREYVPFPEARLVETPPERTAAIDELKTRSLAGLAQPSYDEALTGTREAGKTFPDYDIEAYMNPYRQLVTDQLLDKTRERRDIGRKGIDSAAARAGAFGGGRHGVERGLYEEGTQEQLGDIQERGDMAAFANALSAIQADKTAGLQSSKQLAELGTGKREDLTKGLIGMEKAATAEEAIAQRIKDYGFQDFKAEEQFPQQKLAEYSSIIRGHTPPTDRWETRDVQQAYSPLQTGVGALTALGGLFGKAATGGAIGYHSGDRVDGLSSLVEKPSRENNSPRDVVNESIDILMGMAGEPRYVNRKAREQDITDMRKELAEKKQKRDQEYYGPVLPVDSIGIHEDRVEDLNKQGQDVAEASFSEEVKATMASGGSISDQNLSTYMREGSRSIPPEARTRIKEMYESNGLAYGGVPGQAYTEDIGMVGGLGAVAGPQMRFAYGGVPGQPYTEDIGMMGGLAAVAGPQMRFKSGSGVPPIDEFGDTITTTKEYERDPTISPVMNMILKAKHDRMLAGPQPPRSGALGGYGGPHMGSGTVDMPRKDPSATWNPDDLYKGHVPIETGSRSGHAPAFSEEEISETTVVGEDVSGEEGMSDADKAGVWYGVEDMMMEEEGKPQSKEEAGTPEEKEKAWFEKLGLTQKETIGLGLTLMQGTPDALALAGKSLLGKKDLSDLDRKYKEAMVDYANARTATEKGKTSRDMLRILSTIKKNDENFRLRIAEFAKTIQDADDKWILGMYKGLEPADKMAIFGIPDMKNPGNRIAEIREKVMEFSRMNPARSRTEGVSPVVEQTGTVHGSTVREGKAAGGTIPNTLSKLGISGIRKV